MKTYCSEKIKLAVELYFKYKSYRKVELALNIGKSSVQRWVHNIGTKTPHIKYHRDTTILSLLLLELPVILSTVPCCTLRKIQSHISIECSLSWISRALRILKEKRVRRSFKVFHGSIAKTEEKIITFKNLVASIPLDQIVSIDETGFCNVGNEFYGYGQAFKNVAIHSPKRFKNTCIMAATTSGILCHSLSKESATKKSFTTFISKVLSCVQPTHKYVIMDNISFHHSVEVRSLIASKGLVVIYCPPYTPRFNPIEQVFSILKTKFRENIIQEPSLGQSRFDEIVNNVIDTTIQHHNDFTKMFRHCIRSN